MIEISKITDDVKPVIDGLGIDVKDITVFAKADMTRQDIPGDVLLIMTEKKIYSVEGQSTLIRRDDAKITDGRKLARQFTVSETFEYDTEKVKGLRVEEQISTGLLLCEYDGVITVISAMSRAAMQDCRLFCKYCQKYIDNKDTSIEEDDFKNECFCPKCGSRYPDPNRPICPRCMEKTKLLKRLLGFTKGFRPQIIIILVTLVISSALGVIAPYISTSFFYDKVLTEAESNTFYGQLGFALTLIILMQIASLAVNTVTGVITSKVSGNVTYRLKKTIFGSIERLSLSFFTARQTGGLMNQINNDANTIYGFFIDGVPYFLVNSVQFIAVFIIMLVLNPLLAVCAAVVVPLFGYMVIRLFKRMNTLHAKTYASSRSLNSTLSDALTGFRVVKAFSRENEETQRFNKRSYRLAQDNRNVVIFNNTAFPIATFVMYLSNVIVWGIGGWMTMGGYFGMTYGALMAFIAYVGMMNSPMFMFVDMSYWFSECTNAMQRLFEIADAEPDVREAPEPVRRETLDGKVEFRNVEFSYVKGKKVIDGVSFEIDPGKVIGIVGHTGAGKSTIANLLMRLYDVGNGEILIDDINIKQLATDDLRRNIAIVSQETYLFIGSIADNIRYATPDASFEDVVSAAKIAGAHDFIIKLPDGYNTKIGFGYKELSGGERQRLSIARAVLLNPKILILDEATAAMDTETERKIQNALSLLVKGRTTIMIAHRLSTLRDADKLIVIENGKMPEFGTHAELLRKKGIYFNLYKLQMEALRNIGVEE